MSSSPCVSCGVFTLRIVEFLLIGLRESRATAELLREIDTNGLFKDSPGVTSSVMSKDSDSVEMNNSEEERHREEGRSSRTYELSFACSFRLEFKKRNIALIIVLWAMLLQFSNPGTVASPYPAFTVVEYCTSSTAETYSLPGRPTIKNLRRFVVLMLGLNLFDDD